MRGFCVRIDLVVNKRREDEIEEEAMVFCCVLFRRVRKTERGRKTTRKNLMGFDKQLGPELERHPAQTVTTFNLE